MSAAAQPPRRGGQSGGRARRALVAVSVLALAATAGVWLSRVPIATHVIDRELATRGVPARYHIADLGLGRQRLTNVVIGDPRDPDLVADWVETSTDVGLSGARVVAVRAGRVRARARWIGGKLSLGAIDRLLPRSTGGAAPFVLPTLTLDVADARARVETPAGVVGVKLTGRGRLDDGFAGTIAAVAPRIAAGGCDVADVHAVLAVAIRRGAPTLTGPLGADRVACAGGVTAQQVAAGAQVTLGAGFYRWHGTLHHAGAATVRAPGYGVERLTGTIAFDGDARATTGDVQLALGPLTVPGARAKGATIAGHYALRGAAPAFAGSVATRGTALAPATLRQVTAQADAAAGSPVAPLVRQAALAAARAGRAFDLAARVSLADGAVAVPDLTLTAASGARATVSGDALRIGGVALGGRMRVAGGGLPTIAADLTQRAGGAIAGIVRMAPYAANGARLSLTPIRLAGGRVTTQMTLSGPLGDGGRVDGLVVPVDARWRGSRIALNPACTPVAIRALALSGLRLDPARLTLCPTGAALVEVAGGRVAGGARIGAAALRGTIGGTPLTVETAGGTVRLGDRGFALADVRAGLGAEGRVTRIAAARLDGRVTSAGVAGAFAGLGGQVANVPLAMSAGDGTWRLAGGVLSLGGALSVADTQTPARFEPMAARDVALVLKDGRIAARGTLHEPVTGTKVADVTIAHRLSTGEGHAHLAVSGITFGEGLQPDRLTRLTFGVIADVKGTVSGQGDIDWGAKGVTSTGTFTTPGTDLAAAFGPVTGLAGTIRFTDLLALESAPGQVATVASINPGVPVTDGRIVFQTLRDTKVKVTSGIWPFAGGTLSLDPTLLDFSESGQTRRMTFHVTGMDAGKFLQQFDFSNLNATGVFDGVLPMVFDANGGRIEGGRLTARAGGGGIAYLGELTEKDLGFWGNLAFQSLRSLTYRELVLEMDGPLAGEMVTGVRFTGIRQGAGAKSNFLLRRLTRLPIVFNITIRAPFRGLIDSAASFYDPQRLVARNLQALIAEQNRQAEAARPSQQGGQGEQGGAVQPPESGNVP